ncbi:MAG: hypothetical protein KC423_16575 [Anaerolineales bacterium]|nr:hypothetical protein [Anaerolineales bacterium]
MNTDTTNYQANRKKAVPTLYVVLGVVGILLLVGLFIWGILWLASNSGPQLEAIRDIVIIALALESCIFGVAFILLLIMVIRLINMIEFEVKPILQKTNETVGTIRGTTQFVSQNVVKPVTKASSYMAGIRRGLTVLLGNPRRNLHD